MSETGESWAEKLAVLRRSFDRAFAAPPAELAEEGERFLLVRAGGHPLALRISEISGLETHRRVVPVPGKAPALLGIAGIRGQLVPVFDLALLLGCSESARDARWVVLGGGETPVGLAFAVFDGHETAPRSALHPAREPVAATHVTAALRLGAAVRGVVSIPSILRTITRGRDAVRPDKE
ncbi:chemotaxis protein CheW [bacterium]|nr:chemotaxis protein CheW [bacterium]